MNRRPILIIAVLLLLCHFKMGLTQEDYILDTEYYPPSGEHEDVAIMFLGGSGGGIPKYFNVEKYAAKGYPCIIVGYFRTQNTPDRLEMIPLEYFEHAQNPHPKRPFE